MLFPAMHEIVPEGHSGTVAVEHVRGCCRLVSNGITMMSDARAERSIYKDVIPRTHGDVLVAGLGLGMILWPIVERPEVHSVTVVERSGDVLALVAPYVPQRKVSVIQGDINVWRPSGMRFNVIYFDIWFECYVEMLREMVFLHRSFLPHLVQRADDPERWINSWQRDALRQQRHIWRRLHGTT